MRKLQKIPIVTCFILGLSSPLLSQATNSPTSVPNTNINSPGVPNANTTIPNTNSPLSRTTPPQPGTINPLPGIEDPIPNRNGTRQPPTAEVITCPANQELVQQGNQMVCIPRTTTLPPDGINDPANPQKTR